MIAALLVPFGFAGAAYGRGRTTLVVGYVSAGAPVNGARLAVYTASGRRLKLPQKRAAQESSATGLFVLALPGNPRAVRLVASGGTVRGARVEGSLEALVRHPGVSQVVFINPVSTVIAAYRARGALPGAATTKAMRLLSLEPSDSTGLALLQVTPYFNGLAFLRTARAHGGLRRYVSDLIRRGKPVAFRGPDRVRGFEEYVKYLTTAKDAISGIFSIGKAAYDIFKWAQGPEPTTGDVYRAVEAMKAQLNAIQNSLDVIRLEIRDGFRRIEAKIGEVLFKAEVGPLEDLAALVYNTNLHFKVLIDNATARVFDPRTAKDEAKTIRDLMPMIEKDLSQERDLFRNGILGGRTKPAYYYYGQTLLARSQGLMTPAGSAELRDFVGWALGYQALAFNLIARYYNREGQDKPNAILGDAMKAYLGFDENHLDQAKAFANSKNPSVPPSGNLHDEKVYLDTIQPVPADTIVDSYGTDQSDGTGMMWQWIQRRPGPPPPTVFDFAHIIGLPDGLTCSTTDLYNLQKPAHHHNEDWCPYLWDSWITASETRMTEAEKTVMASTGLAGWKPGSLTQAQAVIGRAARTTDAQFKFDYWAFPPPFVFLENSYRANDGSQICPPTASYEQCGGRSINGLADAMTIKTIEGPTAKVGSCSFGVGRRKGTDCPTLLYALLGRKPDATERYWPTL